MRGAAILLAGVAAGCSSGVSRFTSDNIFTGSTGQQQAVAQNQQAYPAPLPAAPSGSVQRGSMAPVSVSGGQVASSSLPPLSPTAGEAPLNTRSTALAPVSSTPVQQPMQVASLPKPQPVAPAPAGGQQTLGTMNQQPRPATSAAAGGSYTVKSGDTLSKISRETGVSVDQLKAANGLSDGNIRIGQQLALGGAAMHQAKPAQIAAAAKPVEPTVAQPAPAAAPQVAKAEQPQKAVAQNTQPEVKPAAYQPPKQSAREVVEQSDAEAPDATGIGKMRWPVRGRVISNFGKAGGKAGDGIDIAVPSGTPVKAAENGVVIYAGDGLKEFGNTVLVRHDNGLVTVYGHASELKVARGQTVKRGQEVALSGMSGQTDSPKLHFEVRKNSAPVDPSGFLE